MKHLQNVLSLPIVAERTEACNLPRLDRILGDENEICADAVSSLNGGTIAICLSGGVDSSLSLAMIRKRFPTHPIVAYTMGASEDCPDVTHAKEVAERFRVKEHHVIIPTLDDTINAFNAVRPVLSQRGMKNVIDGSVASHLLFQRMHQDGIKSVIHHSGADELFGGSWSHRHSLERGASPAFSVFEYFWSGLEKSHIRPAHFLSSMADVCIVYPYLRRNVVETVTAIKLESRTSFAQSKIPLRDLACKYGVPDSVIGRPKQRQRDSIPPVAFSTTEQNSSG
jgi:asparagine synthetase B (glutamine-hydrolysing)